MIVTENMLSAFIYYLCKSREVSASQISIHGVMPVWHCNPDKYVLDDAYFFVGFHYGDMPGIEYRVIHQDEEKISVISHPFGCSFYDVFKVFVQLCPDEQTEQEIVLYGGNSRYYGVVDGKPLFEDVILPRYDEILEDVFYYSLNTGMDVE